MTRRIEKPKVRIGKRSRGTVMVNISQFAQKGRVKRKTQRKK